MSSTLNIRQIIDAIVHRWRLIAVIVFIVPALAIGLSRLHRPAYEASARLLIQENRAVNPFLGDLMVDLQVQNRFPVIKNLLSSRTIAEEILRDLGELDETNSSGHVEREVDRFLSSMQIEEAGGGVIHIVCQGGTPEQAYNRVMMVKETLVDALLAPQRDTLDTSVSFLEEQLEEMGRTLADAEDGIRRFKEEHAEELPQVFEGNLQRYLSTLSELQQAEANLAVARRQLDFSAEELEAYSVDPMMHEIEANLLQARSRLERMLDLYTQNHPEVEEAEDRIRSLETQLEERLRNPPNVEDRVNARVELDRDGRRQLVPGDLLTGELLTNRTVRGEVEALALRVERLERQRTELREMLRSFAGNEQQLNGLIRDVEAKTNLYSDLASRLQEAQLTREVTVENEAAQVWTIEAPRMPSPDNRVRLSAAAIQGFIVALLLAGAIVFGLEFLDPTVRLPDEAEELVDLPTVAVLPRLDTDRVGNRPAA